MSARAATGLAVAVLGGVYLLRALGDTADVAGPRWLSWLSPIGWGQQFRPYAGNRWWVLLVIVAITAAYGLVARRDVAAGVLPDRPGPATAAPSLRAPLALAWRLHRGSLLGWTAGFVVCGLLVGSVAGSIGDMLNSSEAREVFARLGGEQGLTDSIFAAMLGFLGVLASAYGIQAALRMRAEESAQRTEPLLATPVSRTRWAGSHITIALGGTLLLVGAGLAAGVVQAAQTGDLNQVWRVLGGALVQVSAAWVLPGIVVLAFGFAPRLVVLGWGALAAFLLIGSSARCSSSTSG